MFPSFSSKMLQNGENDDFDDDFSMILGQLSNDKKMIKLREIIIFLSFESSFKSSFLGCSLRFPSKCFKMIEKVASHWKCGENNDFYDDLKYDYFCDFGNFSAGRQYKTNKQKQWIHQ